MITIAAPDIGPRERRYLAEAAESGWLSGRGPFVGRFEEAFAAFCGVRHGVACSSGTVAMHLALAALGVGPGDEVIVPAFTMIGTVNPVRYLGAAPVVVDVRPDTWTLDPDRVRAAVTPRTRAVVVTHVYGQCADVDVIRAAAPGIPVVADAAEAHGASLRGRRAGALADIAGFSFYANKILTTGEGGMVVTDRADLAARCRTLADHAFGGDASRYRHEEIGYSYRMSNLQAAIGLAQAERADELVGRSRAIGERYRALLAGEPGLEMQASAPDARHAWWVFGLVLGGGVRRTRDGMRAALAARGIETRSFFHPIHRQPAYDDCAAAVCPVAERLGERGFYLPSGPGRTMEDVEVVAAAVREELGLEE